MRRAAPGAYTETPEEQYRKSVMSPDYVPETSNRQPLYGSIRGLLDATPAGFLDAAQAGLNRLPTAGGALVRAVAGRAQGPTDAAMNLLGMQGSGPGYEAGRAASGAALAGMGLLGNQAGGQLPRGYARDQSGAIVWHGSPHKFDKFDSSKIGTGEGAQAYGHGLYMAGAKDVARTYAPRDLKYEEALMRLYKRAESSRNYDAMEVLENAMLHQSPAELRKLHGAAAESVVKQIEKIPRSTGFVYKADLPDEQIAKMLDWDKPLNQQAPHVQSAVESVMSKRAAEAEAQRLAMNAQYPNRLTHPVLGKIANKQRTAFDYTGDAAVSSLVQELGGPEKAAAFLRAQGIPGIRYLDGGSRGAGAGSSNYVVFPGNEGLLKILGRE